jgi:hypothetical protein
VLTRRRGSVPRTGARARFDVMGIGWVVLAGIAVLVPALFHGIYLGPYDLLANHGVTTQPGVAVHNTDIGDQISEFIPWLSLSWQQVHAGHLPLWNPYSGLGAPLAFNWQSAPFGLPALVSYIFPLRFAFDVSLGVTMVVGGTGAYVLARVLRLGVLASAMVGTVFELSGPMIGWIGSPLAASISWIGWLCALCILAVRSGGRPRHLGGIAVVTGLAIMAGSPETVVLMFIAVVLFTVVFLVATSTSLNHYRDLGRVAVTVVGGWVLGALLAAPVLLPGLQVSQASIRNKSTYNYALPFHDLAYLVVQGFDGLPLDGTRSFGTLPLVETMSFVGSVALILGVVAVVHGWRRPETVAAALVVVASLLIVFTPAVVNVAKGLPLVGTVLWQRALFPMGFGLAVLAGVGLHTLLQQRRRRDPFLTLVVGSGIISVLVVVGVVWGRSALDPNDAAVRLHGLLWALAASLAAGVVGGLVLLLDRRSVAPRPDEKTSTPVDSEIEPSALRSRRVAAIVLLVVETAALLVAGAPWISSSATGAPTTPAATQLHLTVRGGTVGFDAGGCLTGYPNIGFLPNANILYGVHQLDVYDASSPSALFASWQDATGTAAGVPFFYQFCPQITTSQQARLYGVGWVLSKSGTPGPSGSIRVGTIDDEAIYRIPGAAAATLVATRPGARSPTLGAPGAPVGVAHPNPSTWRMTTRSTRPTVLRLRLLNVPGWHATIDGRSSATVPFAGVMLQLRVPPGHHTVVLTYWPRSFSVGLILAAVALVVLVAVMLLSWLRRRVPRHRRAF